MVQILIACQIHDQRNSRFIVAKLSNSLSDLSNLSKNEKVIGDEKPKTGID